MTRANVSAATYLAAIFLLSGCGNPELEAENARLEGELGDLRRDHQGLQGRLQELETANNQMLEQMRALGQNVSSLTEARAALEAQLQAAQRREEQARARLDAFRRMLGQFREMIASGQLRVRIVRGKMVVELPEGVLFDSGSADLKDSGKATLQRIAQVLAGIENREFLVAGHTDNVPIRSRRFPSNWELSAARGVAVARFLSENGMPATRIAAAGYADQQPVAPNDTEEGRAQNRRIEIVLMPNLDELPDLSSLEGEIGGAAPGPVEAAGATTSPQ